MKHFLTILSTPTPLVRDMLRRAIVLRTRPEPDLLRGRMLCCLFEKPSLRTRVSFEQAMRRLGGAAMSMQNAEVGIGGRESPEDIARVLSSMTDCIMSRVVSHGTLERMASVSTVPVINGLSELSHPAQALADALTMIDEFSPGDPAGVSGRRIAYVGDGNNVARSLAVVCAKLGMEFSICTPRGYELDKAWLDRARSAAPGFEVHVCEDPVQAVLHADAVYCDTFVSMGQEHETSQRLSAFAPFQVNAALVNQAPKHAIVLHCLPAHRGVEITSDVMDGPRSRVFRQARNRLDAQMGLLATLLG
jgi:ornithine carbamoyltransferase